MIRFRSGRALRNASIVLLVMCMAGCGKSSLYGWEVRTNSTPVAPSFDQTAMNDKRVAIFPTLSTSPLEASSVGMSHYLGQILKTMTPSWKVVDEQSVLTGINKEGLGGEYIRMRLDAVESHLLARDSLRKIGAALGVQYVIQPHLAAFSQTMTERWKIPAFDIRVAQTRTSLLRVSMQLWEAESGELIWSSVAETVMESETVTQVPMYLEDAIRLTFGSLMSDLLNRRTASKYTPLNEVLNTLVEKAVPKDQENGSPGGADK